MSQSGDLKFLKTADGIRAVVASRFGTGPNETSSGSLPLTPRLLPLNNRKHRQLRRHQPQRQRILPNTLARRPARLAMRTFILAGRKARTGSRRTRKAGSPSTAAKIATAPRSSHVAGGGDKTKIFIFKEPPTKEIDARCLACHAGGTQHMNAINSEHTQERRQLHRLPFAAPR